MRYEGGVYRIKAEAGEITAPLIIETLQRKGYTITKLFLSKPTLDEVYLEYTGRRIRDSEESMESFIRHRITVRRAKAR